MLRQELFWSERGECESKNNLTLITEVKGRWWDNAGLMLAQRHRRLANITPALGQRLVFAGMSLCCHVTKPGWRDVNGEQGFALKPGMIKNHSRLEGRSDLKGSKPIDAEGVKHGVMGRISSNKVVLYPRYAPVNTIAVCSSAFYQYKTNYKLIDTERVKRWVMGGMSSGKAGLYPVILQWMISHSACLASVSIKYNYKRMFNHLRKKGVFFYTLVL